MRRVLLRTAALGTVVVLGLIAIAQAQRGSDDVPPAADDLNGSSASSLSMPGAADRRQGVDTARAGENPLRSDSRVAEPVATRPSGNVLLAEYHESPATVNPVAAEIPSRMPSADPFGFRADRREAASSPAPSALAQANDDIPSARALGFPSADYLAPPTRDGSAYGAMAAAGSPMGQMTSPATTAPAAGLQAQVSDAYPDYSTGATAGYSTAASADYPTDTATAREPARLSADPYATPAGLATSAAQTTARGGFASPAAATTVPSNPSVGEGTGQPGSQQLEGPQSPQLTIEKSAPPTIQVGKSAKFRVTVRNTGTVAAQQVEIRDEVPQGTRLIGTTPRASRGAGGELVWSVGTLGPGEESTVEMDLEPVAEGEIGSVASVRFQADASARTVVTKPELVLRTSAPKQVLSGEEITLSIEVSNPGSGVATGVVLQERMPAGLQHPAGPVLEYEVGDLSPGESRKLDLTLVAGRPGPVANVLTARGEGNLQAEDRLDLQVISPELEVAVAGPSRRYLEREATYQLSVHNPGTASAEQIELVAYLSDGLEFVSANNSGHYEEASRTVHWRLEELPTSAVGTVELVAMPVEPGQQSIRLHGAADRGVSADGEHAVLVEGITALTSVVVDVDDPIEVGGETTYEVRVLNQGSKAATNVQLAVVFPPEMRPVAGEGPARYAIDSNRILFEGLPRLAPKADVTYRVRAQGLRPGDLRVRVQLLADEMQSPVVKEESTRVYSDE